MKTAPAATFARRVYAAVRRVPRGRVATYGQIAALIGHPRAARAVGTALSRLPTGLQSAVPWQRVVSKGGVSLRRSLEGSHAQRDLLRAEGVEVGAGGRIDLRRYEWRADLTLRRRRGPRKGHRDGGDSTTM